MGSASPSRPSKLALSAVAGIDEGSGRENRNSNGGANEGHKSNCNHACRHFEVGSIFVVVSARKMFGEGLQKMLGLLIKVVVEVDSRRGCWYCRG